MNKFQLKVINNILWNNLDNMFERWLVPTIIPILFSEINIPNDLKEEIIYLLLFTINKYCKQDDEIIEASILALLSLGEKELVESLALKYSELKCFQENYKSALKQKCLLKNKKTSLKNFLEKASSNHYKENVIFFKSLEHFQIKKEEAQYFCWLLKNIIY